MREIAEQLIAMISDLANDHNRESQVFEDKIQQMVMTAFDLLHKQDVNTLNRTSFRNNAGACQATVAPQLPVLALKPDHLSFLMSTADLCIWKKKPIAHITGLANLNVTLLSNNKHSCLAALTKK